MVCCTHRICTLVCPFLYDFIVNIPFVGFGGGGDKYLYILFFATAEAQNEKSSNFKVFIISVDHLNCNFYHLRLRETSASV